MRVSDEFETMNAKFRKHPIIPTGMRQLDEVLLGGFRKDSIIHVYGQPGSGKTTFAMQIVANIIQNGWKAIWVDCNGAFSLGRFQKILKRDDLLNNF